jgi:hypothetical protein
MKASISPRPHGVPAYYLGRPVTTWRKGLRQQRPPGPKN